MPLPPFINCPASTYTPMPTCCLLANLTGQLMIPAGRRHSAVRRHRRRHGTDTDFVCMIPTSAPHPVSDRRQLACDPNNCRGPRSGTPAPTFNNRSVLMSCFSSSDSTAFVISSYFYYSIQVAMPRWLNAHERALIVEMHEGRVKSGDIADLLGMPRSTVSTVLTRWKKFGIITTGNPKP